jgi:hypothetical protein
MQVRTEHLSIRDYIELNRIASAEEGVAIRATLFRLIEDATKVTAATTLLNTLHDLDRLRIQNPESPQVLETRSVALTALATMEPPIS